MFNSVILDAAIGIALVYLFFSIIASTVKEWLAGWLNWRSNDLKKGLITIVNDENAVEKFYNLPLIRSLGNKPSYIPAETFALAIWQLYQEYRSAGISSEWLKSIDTLCMNAQNDVEKSLTAIGTWFDDSMDRLSGLYKRKVQMIILIISFFIVAVFNVDTFRIVNTLYNQSTARTGLVNEAIAFTKTNPDATSAARETAESMKSSLASNGIPIGWDKAPWTYSFEIMSSLMTLMGWIISAFAISLGAPFWFDLLNNFINLRQTGAKPDRSDPSSDTPIYNSTQQTQESGGAVG